jgi:hypothetical protein
LNAFIPPKNQKELNDVIKMCTPGCAMGGKWFELVGEVEPPFWFLGKWREWLEKSER